MRLLRHCCVALLCVTASSLAHNTAPKAKTLNGTYQGLHLSEWDQDAFLGIPFAQPPVGNLRYRHPRSINTSFQGTRHADTYGYSCMQYEGRLPLNMSEDCLTINIIRPVEKHAAPVPVLVWIYGGGLGVGSTADPQYNLSGIVNVSQEMGNPIIAVSMNYRVNHWGFLQSQQTLVEGSSNAGLLDQRMALRWVQENISAFGGDPNRVTVWGESAGAQSIILQMMAYDGRDEGLFHRAILESGGPTGAPIKDLAYWKVPFENLTRSVGCESAEDRLACLRKVDASRLYASRQSQEWQGPLVDGDFLTGYPSQLMAAHKMVRVPVLTGANTDEGISFNPGFVDVPGKPLLDDVTDLLNGFIGWRSYNLSPQTFRKLLELYPADECDVPPHSITNCSLIEGEGKQYRRAASIGGDMVIVAGRRKTCEYLGDDDGKFPVYSYRFNTRLWNRTESQGVQHFDNVAFSFQNITGLLGPAPEYSSHVKLARAIGRAYVRFAYNANPNPTGRHGHSQSLLPYWPRYSLSRPQNMVFDANGSFLESDTWRKEGITYLNSAPVSRELLS
ncbi:unnamed protein product [Clonostachys rosea]|uniref:Carboxylic ester hydrolase n=1 Tax=Bionectria ochroleuca TaxID=29856 RepID=A0ABY6U1X0_BIOOC|nr:unnamed protein product [Clonostachys rosea]